MCDQTRQAFEAHTLVAVNIGLQLSDHEKLCIVLSNNAKGFQGLNNVIKMCDILHDFDGRLEQRLCTGIGISCIECRKRLNELDILIDSCAGALKVLQDVIEIFEQCFARKNVAKRLARLTTGSVDNCCPLSRCCFAFVVSVRTEHCLEEPVGLVAGKEMAQQVP